MSFDLRNQQQPAATSSNQQQQHRLHVPTTRPHRSILPHVALNLETGRPQTCTLVIKNKTKIIPKSATTTNTSPPPPQQTTPNRVAVPTFDHITIHHQPSDKKGQRKQFKTSVGDKFQPAILAQFGTVQWDIGGIHQQFDHGPDTIEINLIRHQRDHDGHDVVHKHLSKVFPFVFKTTQTDQTRRVPAGVQQIPAPRQREEREESRQHEIRRPDLFTNKTHCCSCPPHTPTNNALTNNATHWSCGIAPPTTNRLLRTSTTTVRATSRPYPHK
jgi:hypothetical protein